ncbi:MAG: secretion protein HlyD [Alphaproteobacteria bacterium]
MRSKEVKKGMTRWLLRILLAGVVLAGAVGGYVTWGEAFRSRKAGVVGPLVLHGNVDIRQVDLAFNAEGRIAEMLVEEGDAVAKGQRLAVLEKGYHQEMGKLAQARLEAQQAQVAKLEAGSRPEEIDLARANLAEAEAQLAKATATFRRQEQLSRTSVASQQTLDDARAAMNVASARREAARHTLRLAVLGPRTEELDAARASLRSDEATVALAGRRLADTELFAPEDGVILTRIREPGGVLSSGSPVYTLALKNPVWVRAYVSEPELGRVHPGMTVRIRTDSRPDRPYAGQVGFISPTAEFTPRSVETTDLRTSLVYRLRVVVNDPDAALRQGMPVTLELP